MIELKGKEMAGKKTTGLIKRFAPYYKPYVGTMAADLFCAALTTVCELVLPLIVRYITNLGIYDIARLTVPLVLMLGGLYIVLRIIDSAANFYMASVGHVMGTKIETDMRRDMFDHLQKLPFSYYDNVRVGQIMSRITSDLFDVTEFAHHCPEEFFIAGIKIIVSFTVLSFINLPLTLIIFAIIPFMIVCASYFNKKMKSAFRESRVQIGELNSQVEDSLLGVRVVKSFANENLEIEKFGQGNRKFLSIKRKMYKYMAGFQTTTRMYDGIMYIAVVIAGSIFMIYGQINPADLMAYLLYVTALINSVRKIVEFGEQFQRGMTGIERFIEIMDINPDITDKEDAVELENVKGHISLKNVGFKYGNKKEYVLNDINLEIASGENVALVGPSGGGKTTLCSLIPRFYDVTNGEILVDGINVKDIKLASLRGNIGVVQQDVYMFAGNVYENIEYGRPGASKEEIVDAAKKAGAHDFIMSLPDGYNTNVGERGVQLSGGQKQRISIARVFLKNPAIIILDEATSALDNESERLVQSSLEELSKGRTTITIAHRLSTVKNATKVVVLTYDGIAETGTFDELLNKKGILYNLYNS